MAGSFFFHSWAETFFFIFLLIGIIISVVAPSAFISYIVVFLCGMVAGRLLYDRKKRLTMPYYIIIIGFLIGYLMGMIYGSRKVIILLFIIGAIFSYYLYSEGYVKDLPY